MCQQHRTVMAKRKCAATECLVRVARRVRRSPPAGFSPGKQSFDYLRNYHSERRVIY